MRRNKALTALLATGALGATLLSGLEAAAERGGHSLDPTDSMNYNGYSLRNDSPAALYVHLCSDLGCARLDSHFDWITVRPGKATAEQVYWGPGESAGYAVTSDPAAGSARRCLVDAAAKASAPVDVPLSSATPC
ncbi:MAG: hypothetical protein QOE23_1224 [Pseudonocardiales bacterium]|nr:hypothetical protein [Pseudonocardiales bacterium]